MTLSWKNIRAIDGAQEKGFEEICSQLARDEAPGGAEFVRNGTPDGGVECSIILPDGKEWGWQAKYFFSAADSQWRQLDESVETALQTHPRLTRYYVCLPMSLPDPHVGVKSSARAKWNKWKAKWEKKAKIQNRLVEYILWDSSSLLELLSRPKHAGRVMFWFGTPGCFDRQWFRTKVDLALKSAGPRYTPQLHVDLPISENFDAFGRTQAMVSRVQATGTDIQDCFKWMLRWSDSEETPNLGKASQPLKDAVQGLFELLDAFVEFPFGPQGLTNLIDSSRHALSCFDPVNNVLDLIGKYPAPPHGNPIEVEGMQRRLIESIRDKRHTLLELRKALNSAKNRYSREAIFAENQLLLLDGEAGTGKTHLLCDLATHRLQQNRPTVLLLGQSFTTTDAPSRQMSALLDVPTASLDQIVGCLEAAAQSENARCLIIIDAINEGKGRLFWPDHLSDFCEMIVKSQWIALVLSVRTCYLQSLIPKRVLDSAARTTHHGFEGVQYEAVKLFFTHHGLEFASVPVFSTEFLNPLFLKTLCKGLKESGLRTLPRGFHGITKVFDLYVTSINRLLASKIDYSEKQHLVSKAMRSFSKEMANQKTNSLSIDIGSKVIDQHLPGRYFSCSLYKALLDEGLLMESLSYLADGTTQDVVSIAYERWADHLTANDLLDAYLDEVNPSSAFEQNGPLEIDGRNFLFSEGLIEALSIQLPERIGLELIVLAPHAFKDYRMVQAFLKSIIWRSPEACTEETKVIVKDIASMGMGIQDLIWDTRLAIATIPGHPLNMHFMDAWLRSIPMATRDAEWSVAIQQVWDSEQSLLRLVEWALSVEGGATLDDDSIWLSSLTLCWCFSSSNRCLRDRATKAAVNLLDGRCGFVTRLLRHFASVDDLYIRERVVAVSYGVAVRSFDPSEVGILAEAVYETVFASGTPPSHILLRDYARGIIERSVYLGSKLSFDPKIADPPYNSIWPIIPTQPEIDALKPDWQKIGSTKSDDEWALYSLFDSIENGDFNRYVIGTNSGSTDWLSLKLQDNEWKSPQERLDEFVNTFNRNQRLLWELAERADPHDPHADYIISRSDKNELTGYSDEQINAIRQKYDSRLRVYEDVMLRLRKSIGEAANAQLDSLIMERKKNGSSGPPRFDLRLIQRYIAKRVLSLGWTVELFGWFDRVYMGRFRDGRSSHKAERLGKKYQWIAYHEICALVADHFKYRENRWGESASDTYSGPWQDYFRDIDPTHSLRSLPIDKCKNNASNNWWSLYSYSNWQSERNGREWALDASDLPDASCMLQVMDEKGVLWLNAYSIHVWERARRPSEGYSDAETRRVWMKFQAFFVKMRDVKNVLTWADTVDVGEKWIRSDIPSNTRVFLGEYAWSKVSQYFEEPYFSNDGWSCPGGCPVKMLSIPMEYSQESVGFDCSIDESFALCLPCNEVVRALGLRWSGNGADLIDQSGTVVASDPHAHKDGDKCLLLRNEAISKYLAENKLTMIWAISGYKECIGPEGANRAFNSLRMSGALAITSSGIIGRVRTLL